MITVQHAQEIDVTGLTAYLRRWWPDAAASYGPAEQTLYIQGVPDDDADTVSGRIAQFRPGMVAEPRAVEDAQERLLEVEKMKREIALSPVCRAIWDGSDLAAFSDGALEAARDLMLRYTVLSSNVPAPNWALASRYKLGFEGKGD